MIDEVKNPKKNSLLEIPEGEGIAWMEVRIVQVLNTLLQ